MLRSQCCDQPIYLGDLCYKCKEHCDSFCDICDTEYPNGTEECQRCKFDAMQVGKTITLTKKGNTYELETRKPSLSEIE
jgi:hypothetical protein